MHSAIKHDIFAAKRDQNTTTTDIYFKFKELIIFFSLKVIEFLAYLRLVRVNKFLVDLYYLILSKN